MHRICLFLLLIFIAAMFACAPEDEDGADSVDESVKFDLLVDEDTVFGYARESKIGTVYFSDTKGPVGSRIYCVVQLREIDRFQDATLQGTIELLNPNAIKDDDYIITFDVRRERTDESFYIPQIHSVPTFLQFEFSLSFEEDTGGNEPDSFLATHIFQFEVNQGTPAT